MYWYGRQREVYQWHYNVVVFLPLVCTYAAHARCLENILGQCTGAAKTSAQSMVLALL